MTLPLVHLQVQVYRAHHPMWSFLPVSGAGAARQGGRFNRPGVPCLYTSVSPETAWLEAQQGFTFKAQPLTLCAYEVDCEDVLDLSTDSARESAGVSLAELGCSWELDRGRGKDPETWLLADRWLEAGVAAIRVPSFAHRADSKDVNVVFWHWSEETPHRVSVIDDFGRLPKNRLSWH